MYTAREGWYPGPSIGLEARSETSPTTSDSRTVVTGGGVTIPPPPPVVTTLTSSRATETSSAALPGLLELYPPVGRVLYPIAGAGRHSSWWAPVARAAPIQDRGGHDLLLRCSRCRPPRALPTRNQQALEKRAVGLIQPRPEWWSAAAPPTRLPRNRSTQPAGGSPFSLLSSRRMARIAGPGSSQRPTGVSAMDRGRESGPVQGAHHRFSVVTGGPPRRRERGAKSMEERGDISLDRCDPRIGQSLFPIRSAFR